MPYSLQCSGCGAPFKDKMGFLNHGRYNKGCTEEMRFWGRVNKTDTCWLWTGAVKGNGYGSAHWQGVKDLAVNRLVWRLFNGEIPADKIVMHKCDVRLCVRPDHLQLGTQHENMVDKVRKGREVRCALTEDLVRQVRARLAAGERAKAIAD